MTRWGWDVVLRAFVENVLVAGPFGPTSQLPEAIAALLIVVTAAAAVVAARRPRRPGVLVAMAGLVGAGLAAYVTAVVVNQWAGPRYAYVASVLVIEATIVGAALLATPDARTGGGPRATWLPRLPLIIVVAAVAVGAATSYRLESRTSNGPDYDNEFAVAIRACRDATTESVRVRISPWPSDRNWTVEVSCERVGVRGG